jgi:hypothetical protein
MSLFEHILDIPGYLPAGGASQGVVFVLDARHGPGCRRRDRRALGEQVAPATAVLSALCAGIKLLERHKPINRSVIQMYFT